MCALLVGVRITVTGMVAGINLSKAGMNLSHPCRNQGKLRDRVINSSGWHGCRYGDFYNDWMMYRFERITEILKMLQKFENLIIRKSRNHIDETATLSPVWNT